jgi:hypothetical protein
MDIRRRTFRPTPLSEVGASFLARLNKLNEICNAHKPILLRRLVCLVNCGGHNKLQMFGLHLVGLVLGYPNRYEFGRDLTMRLSALDPAAISNDRGLWSWLALFSFDQLCPTGSDGKRKLDKQYRYILSSDYRHYYRHLVRTPWQLSRDHGPNSRFLLLGTNDGADSLRRHGDILEQLGGTQSIIRSRPVIAEASRLYSDPLSGRPRKGAAGKGGGSIRRFARVLRQLDLTFDPELMPPGGLSAILPVEFDGWKKSSAKVAFLSPTAAVSTAAP